MSREGFAAAMRAEDHTSAFLHASEMLTNDPNDWETLYQGGVALINAGHVGTAWHLLQRAQELVPEGENRVINGLGRCVQETGDYEQALAIFLKAHEINPDDVHAMNNVALAYLNVGDFEEARKWAKQTINKQPGLLPAYDNLALACFALGKFEAGFKYYEKSQGIPRRVEKKYGSDEIRWQGPGHTVPRIDYSDQYSVIKHLDPTQGQALKAEYMEAENVICYGEQGIGDEILFSQCLPEFSEAVKNPIIDCDKRLEGLFKRSFPKATVVGTRYEETKATGLDCRVSMAVLGQWFRKDIKDFDQAPHLVADPHRRRMMRALLDGLPSKLKIGLAWTGGKSGATRANDRSCEFNSLYEDLKDLDASFVSLQYLPAPEIEGAENVYHFPQITQAADYDETAALVAELDLVVSVTTSVAHLAGGLGTPVYILVPHKPGWKYSHECNPDENFYMWRSAKLIRADEGGSWNLQPVKDWCNEK